MHIYIYLLINHILISYSNLILPYSIQSSKSSPSFLSQMNDASMVFAGLWASSRQCRVPGLGSRVNASQQWSEPRYCSVFSYRMHGRWAVAQEGEFGQSILGMTIHERWKLDSVAVRGGFAMFWLWQRQSPVLSQPRQTNYSSGAVGAFVFGAKQWSHHCLLQSTATPIHVASSAYKPIRTIKNPNTVDQNISPKVVSVWITGRDCLRPLQWRKTRAGREVTCQNTWTILEDLKGMGESAWLEAPFFACQ